MTDQALTKTQTHILVVDDHPSTSKTLALALSKLGSDVKVIASTSGYEALELISGNHIDVFITDLMMPGMSGLELFEKMQAHPGGRPTYSIIITAYNVPGLKETAIRLKIDEIIIKPFDPERMVQIVGDALNKIHQKTAPAPREESYPFKILVAVVDMSLTISQMADEFKHQASSKGQTLIIGKIEAGSMVRGDALQLRQVLRNLIGNAIKYTPNGGTVLISLEQHVDTVVINIRDTGYGIPPSDLPHIFDPFYCVRNYGHADIEGNGLGLAIVKSTIEQHDGQITVESEVGKGSCFTITLPFVEEKIIQQSPTFFPPQSVSVKR